jgi:hypothetical protein
MPEMHMFRKERRAQGLSWGDVRGLRALEACPLLPADAFGPIVGLASRSAAYKQLARLRFRGLAQVGSEDLGFLLGDRRRGLWSITEPGRRALRGATERQNVDELPDGTRRQRRQRDRQLPLRVACYRLLAWFLVEEREQGQDLAMIGWDWSWIRELFQAAKKKPPVRLNLPAAAYFTPNDPRNAALSSSRRLLLLPDLGTAPVARYREVLRRVVCHKTRLSGSLDTCDELLVATPDPDGRGTRAGAWRALLSDVARREQDEPPTLRVVSWAQVGDRFGGSAGSAPIVGKRDGLRSTRGGSSPREQILHLLGRHPLLTVRQVGLLLGMTRHRIEHFEHEMIEIGWLRAVDLVERGGIGLDLESGGFARLGLVEVTIAGRRRLADVLGLDPATARRYHGLTGSGRADVGRRRRLLRALAHTIGTNDVFVAFALAAADAQLRGCKDELSEWRSAAACERARCKPDGYGLYTRGGVGYGFLLEYDRGTESTRKYAAKFRAYYRYRDSGQAARDYAGLPTMLFVTTSASAEYRIADQAYRAWFSRGTDPLPVLLTTTERISGHADGVLGPIWRTPGQDSGPFARRIHPFATGDTMSVERSCASDSGTSISTAYAS